MVQGKGGGILVMMPFLATPCAAPLCPPSQANAHTYTDSLPSSQRTSLSPRPNPAAAKTLKA